MLAKANVQMILYLTLLFLKIELNIVKCEVSNRSMKILLSFVRSLYRRSCLASGKQIVGIVGLLYHFLV